MLNEKVDIDAETDAQKLKREYNIKIESKETVGHQVSSFCMKNGAFLEFKKLSTVDRMIDSMNQFMYKPPYLGVHPDDAKPMITEHDRSSKRNSIDYGNMDYVDNINPID